MTLPNGYCEHWDSGFCYHPRAKRNPQPCGGFDQCLLLEQDLLNQDATPPATEERKDVRFETWHDGYRKNLATIKDGEQNESWEYVTPTQFFVGVSFADGWTYSEIKAFSTAEERKEWIDSYHLNEVMK